MLWHVGKICHVTYLCCEKSTGVTEHGPAEGIESRQGPSELTAVGGQCFQGSNGREPARVHRSHPRVYCQNAAAIVIGDMVGTGRDR